MNVTSEFFPEENTPDYFLEHLPEVLTSAHHTWKKISENNWSDASFTNLYEQITDITSKAAFHNIDSLYEKALSLQDFLQLFINKNTTPTHRQIEEFNVIFKQLEQTLADLLNDMEQLPGKKTELVFIVEQGEVSAKLCKQINDDKFSSQQFTNTHEALNYLSENIPAAIIIETSTVDGLAPLHEKLQEIKDHSDINVPSLLISHHDDITLRLEAMRSGVSRYFAEPHDVSQILSEIQQLASPEKFKANRVLIIEDDPTQAEFASSILTKASMETAVVTNPLQVMDTLKEFSPDIILMDIYMPDADGLELTTIIRDDLQYLATPIIFLSGETDQVKQLDALLMGGDDFISKPIRPKHLIATIRNRIKRTRDLLHAIRLQIAGDTTVNINALNPGDSNRIIESDYLASSSDTENPSSEPASLTKNEILSEQIRVALNNEAFKTYYQPILCVKGQSEDIYSLIMTMENQGSTLLWDEILSNTKDNPMQKDLDRLSLHKGLEAINNLRQDDRHGMIFVAQSGQDIIEGNSPDWIRDALRSRQMVGSDLVLEFNLNVLASSIKNARDYFKSLREMGIKICLTEFPAKKAAFKVLQYLKTDFVKTARKLLETESSVINTYISQTHKLKSRVVVNNISDPRRVNLHWTSLADYIQGDFVSPPSDSMNFNFSQSSM